MAHQPLRIFLSYRREDSSGHAGRLYDALAAHFGESHVFMDIDTIELGTDFTEVVAEGVGSCDALIALIGRQWLTASDAEGRRRLDNPEDFVRLEVETALERGVPVIPTLVQGAEHPRSDELPDSLAPLSHRQSLELRDVGWHDGVRRLITRLERLRQDDEPERRSTVQPTEQRARPSRRALLIGAAVVALAAVATAVALMAGSGGGGGGGGPSARGQYPNAAEERLLSVIPPVIRSECKRPAEGDAAAKASIECSAVRLDATYHLFEGRDVMAAWYSQQREGAAIDPGTGTCTDHRFRGDTTYAHGRVLCFLDTGDADTYLIWTDNRIPIAVEGIVYAGKRRPAAALRQWRCCLKIQP